MEQMLIRRYFFNEHRELLACLFLVVLTLAAYWCVTRNDFIVFDDGVYVYENRHVQNGLTSESIAWASWQSRCW